MGDLKVLKEKLEQEAEENLGMAMVYTLVGSAKEWLSERFSQDVGDEDDVEDEAAKDEIIVSHGEPVTVETFLAWREKFEADSGLKVEELPRKVLRLLLKVLMKTRNSLILMMTTTLKMMKTNCSSTIWLKAQRQLTKQIWCCGQELVVLMMIQSPVGYGELGCTIRS